MGEKREKAYKKTKVLRMDLAELYITPNTLPTMKQGSHQKTVPSLTLRSIL